MTINQCFAMNFRHGTGIMHMDPRNGPLSDKSDPPLLNLLATALLSCISNRRGKPKLMPKEVSDKPQHRDRKLTCVGEAPANKLLRFVRSRVRLRFDCMLAMKLGKTT